MLCISSHVCARVKLRGLKGVSTLKFEHYLSLIRDKQLFVHQRIYYHIGSTLQDTIFGSIMIECEIPTGNFSNVPFYHLNSEIQKILI